MSDFLSLSHHFFGAFTNPNTTFLKHCIVIHIEHFPHIVRWCNENVSHILISTQERSFDVAQEQATIVRSKQTIA